jgi:hypothetical protein
MTWLIAVCISAFILHGMYRRREHRPRLLAGCSTCGWPRKSVLPCLCGSERLLGKGDGE